MNESADGSGAGDDQRSGRWERASRDDSQRQDRRRGGDREDRRGGYGSRGGDREDRRGGYGSRGGDREDRRGGYGSRGGDREDRRGGYGSRGGDREDRRGGYGSRGGDREDRRGGYGSRGGDREDRRGGYGSRGGDREDRRGGYGSRGGDREDRRGGYGSRGGDREDRRGGYGSRGGDREDRRGGSGEQAGPEHRRGPRSWDRDSRAGGERQPRRREPDIPEGITGKELDRSVWQQLRTLSKENAEGVAQHLAASAMLLEEDPDLALEHAQNAVRRAGRVPAAREALGLVLYRRGEFTEALREFRTARRLSGSEHLLPYMVDCERGLGRHQRALELATSPEARKLAEADNIELAIVVSGVRRDLGQPEAAVMGLRIPALTRATQQPWAARLFYAYADAVLDTGDEEGAHEWFSKALAADQQGETDAATRLAELEGLVITDLEEGGDEDGGSPRTADSDAPAAAELSDTSDVDPGSTERDNDGPGPDHLPFSSPERPL